MKKIINDLITGRAIYPVSTDELKALFGGGTHILHCV